MSFEPQNNLERSLMKAADDPAHRPQFYRDLAEADLFVVQHGGSLPAREQPAALQAGSTVQLRHMERDGKTYLPVFTSLLRLEAVLPEKATYLRMNARKLLKLTQGATLLLNPGSAYGKEITPAEALSIADGSIWQPENSRTVAHNTQVLLGQPARYPTELAVALARFFKAKKQVKRAWLAHFHDPSRDEKAHTLVAIEAAGDFAALSAETGIVARNITVPDPPVDIVAITGEGSPFENYFLQQTKPFYERRFLGLF